MPKAESQTLWYTGRDLIKLDRLNRYTIAALRRSRNKRDYELNEEECCLRGLEDNVSIRASQVRKAGIVSVIQSVLDEQRRQQKAGIYDPDRISSVSQRHSSNAKCKAHERALGDENEVRISVGGLLLGVPPFEAMLLTRQLCPLEQKKNNKSPRSTEISTRQNHQIQRSTNAATSAAYTLELLTDALAVIGSDIKIAPAKKSTPASSL
jgi:hypothetical protein